MSCEQLADATMTASQMEVDIYIRTLKQRVSAMDVERAKAFKDYLDRNFYLTNAKNALGAIFEEKGIY